MGLPLAPELARMSTTYLLRNYSPPPNEHLTLYFDDVAASYPIEDLPLAPYTLKTTAPNTTQDCIYDPISRKFKPLQQQFRQPVLLYPESYHPSKRMTKNTYISSAFRAAKTSTDPADALNYLIRKYLPTLVRNGHDAKQTLITLINTTYFPQQTTKKEWEFKPIIKYTWTNTRPTKKQLTPIELKDYHLIPNLPLAPLKGLLAYQLPTKFSNHIWNPCRCNECIMCTCYRIYTANHLNVPITPCNNYRCLYLLTHEQNENEQHLYLGSTLDPKITPQNAIANHLTKASSLGKS